MDMVSVLEPVIYVFGTIGYVSGSMNTATIEHNGIEVLRRKQRTDESNGTIKQQKNRRTQSD